MLAACPVVKPDPGAVLQRNALKTFDLEVARPTLEQAVAALTALREAVQGWAATPDGQDAAQLATARARFEAAFLVWQRAELLQLGPLGAATRVTAGEGLRDEIYSWPTTNLCRVDAALVANTAPDDAWFETALATSKGLVVLEELLFNQTASNSCPANATINTDGSWAALAATRALAERRKAWALGAARHVERTAGRARDAWIVEGGFGDKLAEAGSLGSAWRTPKDGLDDVYAGLFYVDRAVKDFKLGGPAGLTMACLAPSCPELAESPRAGLSTKALVENLVMTRAMLTGSFDPSSSATGFDDLLEERGAGALESDMLAALDAAIGATRAAPRTVQDAATADLNGLRALHASVKAFSDLFKSQFVTTLSLKVPKEGAGDND
ncbi:MAG: imelysin family protein [Myxococcaceae bacterium]|nr:imelysin family protein [Myxococcaceae bacterium]